MLEKPSSWIKSTIHLYSCSKITFSMLSFVSIFFQRESMYSIIFFMFVKDYYIFLLLLIHYTIYSIILHRGFIINSFIEPILPFDVQLTKSLMPKPPCPSTRSILYFPPCKVVFGCKCCIILILLRLPSYFKRLFLLL